MCGWWGWADPQGSPCLCVPLVVTAFHFSNLTHLAVHRFSFVHLLAGRCFRPERFKQRNDMILFTLKEQPSHTQAAVVSVSVSTPHLFAHLLVLDWPRGLSPVPGSAGGSSGSPHPPYHLLEMSSRGFSSSRALSISVTSSLSWVWSSLQAQRKPACPGTPTCSRGPQGSESWHLPLPAGTWRMLGFLGSLRWKVE